MKKWMAIGGAAAIAVACTWTGITLAQAPSTTAPPAAAGSTAATQAQQDAAAIVAAMGKSMKALTTYTYQQRVQMSYDGELKSTTLNQISFDATGKPVVLQLSVTTPDSDERRLGHRAVDNKKEEIAADVKQLIQLATGYMYPDQAHLQQLAQGTVSYKAPSVMLSATNFQQPSDAMTITAASSNMMRTSSQVTTAANKTPVTIAATYSNLESGLNYLSHYVVSWPSEKIQLTFDTLNYAPAQTAQK